MGKAGRPSKYSEALAVKICERIADGESLKEACSPEGMPARSTVYLWLRDGSNGFLDMYARAREERGDLFADEVIEIADTEADPQVARVRIDARKWSAARLNPKRYGDKIHNEHTGADGGPIKTENVSASEKLEAYLDGIGKPG